jgi:hypothetical protein
MKSFQEWLSEAKRPKWRDSDAPEAEGRFRDLSIRDLAAWLIKTRKSDLKKISGSLTQQIVFNRNEDPEYAEKMEKTRKEVYRQLGRKDLLAEAELTDVDNWDVDRVVYGNQTQEFQEIAEHTHDRIKNWFIAQGWVDKLRAEAPRNSSGETRADLEELLQFCSEVTADEITFARYVDDVSNLAQTFIDLLKAGGYDESMGDFFRIDSQTDSLLFFLKDVINRPRPYQLAKCYNMPIYPLIQTDAMTASYPSGHALTGLVMSRYYAQKYPALQDELKALGEKIARSREITAIHYPSDTRASRKIADIIFENNLIQ